MNLFKNNGREEFAITDKSVFNMIYGQNTEESKKALTALLNSVALKDTPIKEVNVLNHADYDNKRNCSHGVFNIRLKTDAGDFFDVEMDKQLDCDFQNRCVLCITELFDDEAENYEISRRKIAGTSFLISHLSDGKRKSMHLICESASKDRMGKICNKMHIHFIEVDNADKTRDISEMKPIEKVALYFRYASDPDNEELLQRLIDSGEEAIVLAENVFRKIISDDTVCERMRASKILEHRYQTDLSIAREFSFEQGRLEGIAVGEKIAKESCEDCGREERETEIVRAMKAGNEPVEKIVKYTGLSEEDIEKL